MRLRLINMDYRLLQLHILNVFLGVHFHGVFLSNLFFSMPLPKFDNGIVKLTAQIHWIQNFTTFLTLVSELLDIGIIDNAVYKINM